MKAVILLAGFGSRLRPLTEQTHKALLPIGNSCILEQMVSKLLSQGIDSFVVVTGYRAEQIKNFFATKFPELDVVFVHNPKYETTNTGYSLMLTEPYLGDSEFIKFDGDVIFDEQILTRLLAPTDQASYICLDNTAVDNEVIKAQLDKDGVVQAIGKDVPVEKAAGESIGIERISAISAPKLFTKLKELMNQPEHQQSYYEVAYDRLVHEGEIFKTVDITGLKWVEMDNKDDYQQAQKYFG